MFLTSDVPDPEGHGETGVSDQHDRLLVHGPLHPRGGSGSGPSLLPEEFLQRNTHHSPAQDENVAC